MAKATPLPRIPKGFTRSHSVRCDDCEYRGALDNVGRPLYRRGVRLTTGCENCGGSGRTPLERQAKTDPYHVKGSGT